MAGGAFQPTPHSVDNKEAPSRKARQAKEKAGAPAGKTEQPARTPAENNVTNPAKGDNTQADITIIDIKSSFREQSDKPESKEQAEEPRPQEQTVIQEQELKGQPEKPKPKPKEQKSVSRADRKPTLKTLNHWTDIIAAFEYKSGARGGAYRQSRLYTAAAGNYPV